MLSSLYPPTNESLIPTPSTLYMDHSHAAIIIPNSVMLATHEAQMIYEEMKGTTVQTLRAVACARVQDYALARALCVKLAHAPHY